MFICVLLLSVIVSAQPAKEFRDGTVSGRVIDASLNQPLPYVNVIIKTTANQTITGGITKDDGTFEIKSIPEGDVVVSIQYIGFKTIAKTVSIGKNGYDIALGDIMLEEDVASLDEVTVVA